MIWFMKCMHIPMNMSRRRIRSLRQKQVIRSAAKKGNCVIVGRCADAILKDDPDCIGIFLSAPLKTRIQMVMKRYGLDEKAAKRRIEQTDRRRADNYRYYTRRIWGCPVIIRCVSILRLVKTMCSIPY